MSQESAAHVELDTITKSYAGQTVLDRLSLTVHAGERLALLGPSGCGKTTTLSLIAGFLKPDSGRILVNGRDIINIAPHRRNVGMVFQTYALFPHLTVRANIAFGLQMRSVPSLEADSRINEALNVVRLHGLEDRLPHQISGGQQQRVAIARALVIYPDLLLLDEPLSNLDAKLRQEMLVELVEILERINITTIFVTHDQDEALALADRVVVMNEGRVEQIGTPRDIYLRPSTGFVAKFLGEANVLSAIVLDAGEGLVRCAIGDALELSAESTMDVSPGMSVEVIVRAERVHLSAHPTGRVNSFQARVEHVLFLGGDIRYVVYVGNHRLVSVEKNNGTAISLAAGQSVYAEWQADELLLAAI